MEKTGQWRFTPPTHVMVALAEAIQQFEDEGGQPARLKRYQNNCKTLVEGMAAFGFKPYLDPSVQAPIIVTFHSPDHPNFEFVKLYEGVKAQGFILYPGKLTQIETFRVGCIGAIDTQHIFKAVEATERTLRDLGVLS
jgi:2-aminoethylphosphonate-pyruvate transaminase